MIKQNFLGLIVGRLVQFRSHFVKHYQIIINSLFLAKSLFCRLIQFWGVQFQHLVAAFIMCESIAHGLLLRCGLCLFSSMGRAWEVVVFSFGWDLVGCLHKLRVAGRNGRGSEKFLMAENWLSVPSWASSFSSLSFIDCLLPGHFQLLGRDGWFEVELSTGIPSGPAHGGSTIIKVVAFSNLIGSNSNCKTLLQQKSASSTVSLLHLPGECLILGKP